MSDIASSVVTQTCQKNEPRKFPVFTLKTWSFKLLIYMEKEKINETEII